MASESPARMRRAGAFDIRLIISLLTGVYGVVLTIMGIAFTDNAELEKAAGVNINLWAGIGLLVFTALMVLWAVVRPIRVPVSEGDETPAG